MSKKILVIDDEQFICDLLQIFLTSQGYHVTAKNNCLIFLDSYEELKNYDAIIIDHNMPNITGTEFTKKIRSTLPETLIIGISAYSDCSKAFIEAGADIFIQKPFNIMEILNIIKTQLSVDKCLCKDNNTC